MQRPNPTTESSPKRRTMDTSLRALSLLLLLAGDIAAAEVVMRNSAELLPPVKVTAEGQPIDIKGFGHAAPFLGDFDGDGADDFLVGQFHHGQLRVYRNTGSNAARRFSEHVLFQDGAENGRVPAG